MTNLQSCPICKSTAASRPITVRGGKGMTIWHCGACNFDFFAHDPTSSLAANRLDQTRLQAAGLDIPTLERDFANGLRQSAAHIADYVDQSDRGKNILEIGCSWGYFLKLVRDCGANPYGVEVNAMRCDYVKEQLGIPCDGSLAECEARGLRFKKIFLFYVLEYVPHPVEYVQRLVDLLEPGGKLIFITPNLVDPLKDLWRNEAFATFFHDEHAINYLSPLSLRRLIEQIRAGRSVVSTKQGYSIVNHISWFLTNAPRTTGVVGGDNFIRDIVARLRSTSEPPHETAATVGLSEAAGWLAGMIERFDASYREYLESRELGNQIHVTIER